MEWTAVALVEHLMEQMDFILQHTAYMSYDCSFFAQAYIVEFVQVKWGVWWLHCNDHVFFLSWGEF